MIEPNAMVLSTVSSQHLPSSRIVLLKDISEGGLVFFTNYESRKGEDMKDNPHAALLFFWPELQRQIRIEGIIELVNESDSDEYFQSRPKGSRIGALASPKP
ncbi:pyridoxal 5'-phosphate synthase [Sphingobacterium sp. E70]|uniref:pyridoxal 5'-phosphate synthase n=1 Tax=Sphingobacterium sp. E70 TaxID=2853439 RepID=UPI002795E13A|nr:pyridoxal 5'-phosphate synthase [Sphingobacterium sp. E70]